MSLFKFARVPFCSRATLQLARSRFSPQTRLNKFQQIATYNMATRTLSEKNTLVGLAD
jgi:hypothetical protein